MKNFYELEEEFKALKVGDRGIFNEDGQEFFVAKKMPKLKVGIYKERIYILPIEYLENVRTGIKNSSGYQITAGHYIDRFRKEETEC